MQIRLAETEADFAAVRMLCRAYRALLADRWPDHPQFLARYYAEDGFEDLLDRLPELHCATPGADGSTLGYACGHS